ncbi:hypothetical protein PVAP13_8KG115800 [Panicum virgatum]|uniref:Uncharacterized protein n=1 Tax=Panicum virgatum TaxID=38727 RepID=A0A8T0PF94_PANVG|nr:hypothetical protein PVAP13_8KG115800 [Panicum virgatum]
MSSTILSTTNAGDVRCDILREKCNERNCNELQCKHWYGEHHFESVCCKKTPPFPDLCCCELSTYTKAPRFGALP